MVTRQATEFHCPDSRSDLFGLTPFQMVIRKNLAASNNEQGDSPNPFGSQESNRVIIKETVIPFGQMPTATKGNHDITIAKLPMATKAGPVAFSFR